jgi:hypothetical protein
MLRIESRRGDGAEAPGGRLLAVFPVDVEEIVGRRLIGRRRASAAAAQPCSERRPNAFDPFGAEARDFFEAAVMGGELEFLQRFDAEIVVDALGQSLADGAHRSKERLGIDLAFQALEHAQAARLQQFLDGTGQRGADSRDVHQAFKARARQELCGRLKVPPHVVGSAPVGIHAILVCSLFFEQFGDVFQRGRDLFVGRCGHGSVIRQRVRGYALAATPRPARIPRGQHGV